MFSKLSTSSIFRTTAFLLTVGMIILLLILGESVIIPLAFSAFIATVLTPLSEYLEEKGVHCNIAAFLSVIVALIVILGVSTFFAYQMSTLTDNIRTFDSQLNKFIGEIATYVGQKLSNDELSQLTTFQDALGFVLADTQNIIGSVLTILAAGFIAILFLLSFTTLFLIYRKDIREFGVYLFSDDSKSMRHLLLKVERVVRNYLVGIFQVILILAVCNCLALWLLDVPNALFFGIFSALLNIVPFIGPIVGSIIPALFVLVISGSELSAVWVILYFIVIQSIESYAITPNIVGNKVRINPMFTLLAIFVGNLIWGVAGMILFIPLTAVLKQIFDEVSGLQPYASLLGELDEDYFKSKLQEEKVTSEA